MKTEDFRKADSIFKEIESITELISKLDILYEKRKITIIIRNEQIVEPGNVPDMKEIYIHDKGLIQQIQFITKNFFIDRLEILMKEFNSL